MKELAGLLTEGYERRGVNVRRNEASELMCLTVKDIFEALDDGVEESAQGHSNSS